jgi:hypothetical protein
MVGIKEMLRPKQWLLAITLFFTLIFIITLPQSASAPFIFLKNIEVGSFEFVNMLGLIRDLSMAVLFSGLYISMLAILSSIINVQFKEIAAIVVITSVIALFFWGVPGLFILTFLYYCHEIREFTEKMRHADPRIVSAIPMTMTFVIIGLLGGLWAARGQLYFEHEGLEFARGFGKIWLGCETDLMVKDCVKQEAELKIGYNLLLKNCEPLEGEAKLSCIQRVEATKQDTYGLLISQFEDVGDIDHTVGEFTTIALAQYLNTWAGLLPMESKFVLAMIIFSLVTLIGFVLEIFVPLLTSLLMDIFVGYKIIHTYEKEEKAKHYVILD